MKSILVTSFYQDKNPIRNGELQYCLQKNTEAGFDALVFFVESEADMEYLDTYMVKAKSMSEIVGGAKVPPYQILLKDGRPTFNHFLAASDLLEEDAIKVIANSDIYFDKVNLAYIKAYFEAHDKESLALALTRWDFQFNGTSVLFDRPDSQDTWVIYGKPKGTTEIEFTMGVAGCDNRFAYELQRMGYTVKNPSRTIKTYHYHLSGQRNYLDEGGRPKEIVPPPYLLLQPE